MESVVVLRAGLLSKRVTLQTLVRTADAGGGATETWSDTATMWARVAPLTGTERFAAQQIQSGLSTEVEIRYRTGVVPQQRFTFAARLFYIEQVINPRERNRSLICMCAERNV